MKKVLLFFAALAFAFSAMATDQSFDFSAQGYANAQSFDGETINLGGGITAAWSKGEGSTNPTYYTTGTAIRLYGSNTVTFASENGPITQIVCTYSSTSNTGTISADCGNYSLSSTTGTWTGNSSTVVLTNTATSGNARLKKVVVTYAASSSTPVITAAETISLTADEVDNGSFSVTWSSLPVKGVAVYTDEACETPAGNDFWFSAEVQSDGSVFYMAEENTNTTIRTAYMQLYQYDANYTASSYITQLVTVTQAAAIPSYSTIPAAFAAATTTAAAVKYTFSGIVVTAATTKNAYLQDANGNVAIIYNTTGHGFTKGQTISGTIECDIQLYNGILEFTGITSSTTGLTLGTGTPVAAEKHISEITTADFGKLVTFSDVTYDGTNSVFAEAGSTIVPYGTFMALPDFADGQTYSITGIIVLYTNKNTNVTTIEIAPRDENDIQMHEAESYEININTIQNGTVTADKAEAVAGETVTLTVTSAEHYKLATLTVTDEDGGAVTVTNNTFVMPAKSVEIDATFAEIAKHSVTWSVNGETTSAQVYEGDAIAFTDATAPEGTSKVFVGWTTAAIEGTTDVAPTLVSNATMGEADVTYYAVFAVNAGGENVTYDLTQEQIAAAYVGSGDGKTTAYGNFTFGEGWSGSCVINKYSDTYFVQIRKNAANNYLLTPDFGKAVISVTLNTTASGSTTSTPQGRTFYLCADNSVAQPSAGTYGQGSLTEANGSVTIDVTDAPSQLYIYANGGAYIQSISVVCSGASYSAYCTTVEADPEYDYYMVGSAELFGAEGMKMDANGTDAYRLTLNNVELAGGDYTYNVEARPVVEQSNAPRHIAAAAQADKSFTLAAGTYSLQFDYNAETGELTSTNLTNGFPTSLDNTEAQKVEKIFRNGQVVIIKNGVEYNAIGQKL